MSEPPNQAEMASPGIVDGGLLAGEVSELIEGMRVEASSGRVNEHSFETRINLAGLTDGGQRACSEILQQFGSELAGEASRVTQYYRQSDADEPEVTASTIRMAYKGVLRRQELYYTRAQSRNAWTDRGITVIATLGMAVAGFLATYLHSKWQVALFTSVVLLGSLSTLYIIWRQQ